MSEMTTTGSLSPAVGIAVGSIIAKAVGIVPWSWTRALLPVWSILGSVCFVVVAFALWRTMLWLAAAVLTTVNDRSARNAR